jgi:drug/metabolite transporter (DMT)-like permease
MVVLSVILLCFNVMWLRSSASVPVSTTNLLFQTTIVITPLGAALFRLEPLTGASALAAVFAMMGVALAAGPTPTKHDGGVHGDASGVLFGLAAAFGCAVYSLLWKMLGTKTAPFVATAYWAIAAVHLLAFPAYPVLRAHGLIEAWRLPPTHLLKALLVLSAVIASSVNMINIFIIAKAGPGVLAIGSAASIPIAFALDLLVHGEIPGPRELAGCSLIVASVGLTLASQSAETIGGAILSLAKISGQGKSEGQASAESVRDLEGLLDEGDGSRRRRSKSLVGI